MKYGIEELGERERMFTFSPSYMTIPSLWECVSRNVYSRSSGHGSDWEFNCSVFSLVRFHMLFRVGVSFRWEIGMGFRRAGMGVGKMVVMVGMRWVGKA